MYMLISNLEENTEPKVALYRYNRIRETDACQKS